MKALWDMHRPANGGSMAARIHALVQAEPGVGAGNGAPDDFQTMLDLVLRMRQPAGVCWGPEARLFYNDDYSIILGDKHPHALGQPLSEIWPELMDVLEPSIAAVLAGEPQTWEETPFALAGRGEGLVTGWFTVTWTPIKQANGSIGGFLMVATETTLRHQAEAELRAKEERQAFLLKLSDAVRNLVDADAIKSAASGLLGEHLGADRVGYAELLPDGEHMVARREFARIGPAHSTRVFRPAEFGSILDDLLRGRVAVIPDAATHPASQAFIAEWEKIETRAAIAYPIVKDDRLAAVMYVQAVSPRNWSQAEADLVGDVGERTWEAVERARAVANLREREADLARVQRIGGVGGLDIDIANGLRGWRSPEYLRLHGLTEDHGEEAHAQWLARLHPGDLEQAEATFLRALNSSEMVYENEYRIIRPSDGAVRWIHARADIERDDDGRAVRLRGAHSDVTEHKELQEVLRQSEERQNFLLRLSDRLRPLHSSDETTEIASQMLGAELGASRAFYVEYDAAGGFGDVLRDYAVAGLPSLAGRYPFETFRKSFERIAEGRTWVVEDLMADETLSAGERDFYLSQGIAAWVDVPLVKNGDLKAILCIVQTEPRRWSPRDISLVEAVAERTWAAVERARVETSLRLREEQLTVMVGELQHRTRNLMTVVEAISKQTLAGSVSLETFQEKFNTRMKALSRVQGLLSRRDVAAVGLRQLVEMELDALGGLQQSTLEGSDVRIRPTYVQTLALAVHELVTNALKHGALSREQGRLRVDWRLEDGDIVIDWAEDCGDAAAIDVTANKGYGRELIEKALPYTLGAKVAFQLGRHGLHCRIVLPPRVHGG